MKPYAAPAEEEGYYTGLPLTSPPDVMEDPP